MILPPPCSTLFPYTTLFRSFLRRVGKVPVRHRRTVRGRVQEFVNGVNQRLEVRAVLREGRGPGNPIQLGVLRTIVQRSEEHTSELQSQSNLVCRLLLEKKKK